MLRFGKKYYMAVQVELSECVTLIFFAYSVSWSQRTHCVVVGVSSFQEWGDYPKADWRNFRQMGLKQSWTEEKSVFFSLPLFAPVNFCSLVTVLPLESGICSWKHPLMLRHVYELFSASFDITSLGHSIRSFALWPSLNKFITTVLGRRTSSSYCHVWGQCGQPQLLKNSRTKQNF